MDWQPPTSRADECIKCGTLAFQRGWYFDRKFVEALDRALSRQLLTLNHELMSVQNAIAKLELTVTLIKLSLRTVVSL